MTPPSSSKIDITLSSWSVKFRAPSPQSRSKLDSPLCPPLFIDDSSKPLRSRISDMTWTSDVLGFSCSFHAVVLSASGVLLPPVVDFPSEELNLCFDAELGRGCSRGGAFVASPSLACCWELFVETSCEAEGIVELGAEVASIACLPALVLSAGAAVAAAAAEVVGIWLALAEVEAGGRLSAGEMLLGLLLPA